VVRIETAEFNAREQEESSANKTRLIGNIRKPFRGKDLLHRIVMLASASLSLASASPSINTALPSASPSGGAERPSFAVDGTPLSSARLISQGVRAGLTGVSVPPIGLPIGPAPSSFSSPGSRDLSAESRRPGAIRPIAGRYPLRILLAEDNIVNQKMMVMLLKKLGYSIAVAENGEEALKHLAQQSARGREHEVQVILMDASMAVMDGLECTRVIRAQQLPHRTRPFIAAQTANVTDAFRQQCLAAGMDCFSQCHERQRRTRAEDCSLCVRWLTLPSCMCSFLQSQSLCSWSSWSRS
jgi:CheY-like chemotaxis protein